MQQEASLLIFSTYRGIKVKRKVIVGLVKKYYFCGAPMNAIFPPTIRKFEILIVLAIFS